MRKWILGFLVLIGMIYYLFNPNDYIIYPKCPFLLLTEFKCPGCGSQRAIHYLLHLDIISAFKCNMLLIASLPYIGILLYVELTKNKNPSLYYKVQNYKLVLTYLIIVITWWIIRNVIGL